MANNKTKLKKAALMAGISAMSMLPLKSGAQTPAQDKKQNAVEITINPDKIRENINILKTDSINIAHINAFAAKNVNHQESTMQNANKLVTSIKELTDILYASYATNRPVDLKTLEKFTKMFECLISFTDDV